MICPRRYDSSRDRSDQERHVPMPTFGTGLTGSPAIEAARAANVDGGLQESKTFRLNHCCVSLSDRVDGPARSQETPDNMASKRRVAHPRFARGGTTRRVWCLCSGVELPLLPFIYRLFTHRCSTLRLPEPAANPSCPQSPSPRLKPYRCPIAPPLPHTCQQKPSSLPSTADLFALARKAYTTGTTLKRFYTVSRDV